jgi:MATE family multidrug resistance protein
MLQLGLSNAVTVRAGNAVGRGDARHLVMGAWAALLLGTLGVALSMVAFLGFPGLLLGAFVGSDEPARDAILATGTGLLAMAALFQLGDAAQVIHLGLLRGLQDTRVPMVMAALAYWGVGMPAAWVCAFPLGLGGIGVWLGLSIGLAVAALGLGWRFWTKGAAMLGAQAGGAVRA